MEHDGKCAIVTGGGGGMGRAIAGALATEGATVAIVDLDLGAAQGVADEIVSSGRHAIAVQADVADRSSVEAMADQVLETCGTIDILVNNAGSQHVAPIVDFPEEQWHRLMGIMLDGTFFCTQAALRSMIPRQTGRIINISSTLGKEGAPYKPAYTAAKHGIIGLTRSVALEVAELGITVNAICPGTTDTPIVKNQLDDLARAHGTTPDQVLEEVFFPHVPQKRLMKPQEIADFAVYLASDKAYGITGQAISVSAGW